MTRLTDYVVIIDWIIIELLRADTLAIFKYSFTLYQTSYAIYLFGSNIYWAFITKKVKTGLANRVGTARVFEETIFTSAITLLGCIIPIWIFWTFIARIRLISSCTVFAGVVTLNAYCIINFFYHTIRTWAGALTS